MNCSKIRFRKIAGSGAAEDFWAVCAGTVNGGTGISKTAQKTAVITAGTDKRTGNLRAKRLIVMNSQKSSKKYYWQQSRKQIEQSSTLARLTKIFGEKVSITGYL